MRRVMRFRCTLSRSVKSGQATSPYSTFLQRLPPLTDTTANRGCVVRLRLLNEHVQTTLMRMQPRRLLNDHTSSCLKMGDILIPSLMVGDCSHSLCVRVSRLWEFLHPQDDSRLLHTDLVLLDEECPRLTRYNKQFICKLAVLHSDRDTGPTVDVVLWGEWATAFPAEQIHRDSGSSPQIIIFVGTLVRSYADNVSLSGGSSCKWYINAPVPEVNALRTSAETNHHPVIWDQGKAAARGTVIAVPEHKKLKDIKYLHPFENKKKEWLVIVKILKIDRSWWYNACKKCLRTTKPHGDTYKCTNSSCDSIGSPTPSSSCGSNLFFCLAANSAVGQGSGVTQNRGAAFIREPSLTPESHKVSSIAKGNIQPAPHQGDNLLQGTEIVTSPPSVQTPSGAAYSVLDGSTNKAHRSVTGKRLGLGHHLLGRLPRNFLEMKTQEMTMLLVLETLMLSSGTTFKASSQCFWTRAPPAMETRFWELKIAFGNYPSSSRLLLELAPPVVQGIVFENTLMQHHVALPPGSMRKISYIAPAGQYNLQVLNRSLQNPNFIGDNDEELW
ncbi:putative replication protein [Zea mays]|uniref:Putative replication protein n=1 Tax=Zea mays TaxID=4577 RepID=A0A1D6G133_MAIZE|nr:putative replication protein [Zea mays]